MPKRLLIVESPNKKKKILQLLDVIDGPGRWYVAASVGHVQDLPQSELGINREKNYAMSYQVSPDKKAVVAELKRLTAEVGIANVVLATDPDREGEAISWHISRLLGISPTQPQRATFGEITQTALQTALKTLRPLNMNLVKAQEARRAIDRLAGYEISTIVSRKTGKTLSAGRVQSVALKLIVEREKQIAAFSDQFVYKLTAQFATPAGETVIAQYVGANEADRQRMCTVGAIQAFLATASPKLWRVLQIETKPVFRQPGPAFTTSTLQQDAIQKLSKPEDRWSAKRVMDVAQSLFAAGHITYMRTDSPNLSEEAVEAIQQQVINQFGASYFEARRFPVKKDAQEAHEAIRPTHMEAPQAGSSPDEQALYRLIYTRALASQMKPAEFAQTTLTIGTTQPVDTFQAKATILRFAGYRAIYTDAVEENSDPESNAILSPIGSNTSLKLQRMQGKQTYRQPPKRFDEATLVKSMEQKGIGRPSTYASILSNIQKRVYIETTDVAARKLPATILTLTNGSIKTTTEPQAIGGDRSKLVPTSTGLMLTDFLATNFANLVDYSFTSSMELQLDQIIGGQRNFLDVVQTYDRAHCQLIQQANQAKPDAERQTVTRLLGEYAGKAVRVGTGKAGTYLLYDSTFSSVAGLAADQVTLPIAIELLTSAPRPGGKSASGIVHKAGFYEVRKGQYGYYLTDGQNRAKLPKQYESLSQIKTLKAADAKQIMVSYLEWKKKQGGKSTT